MMDALIDSAPCAILTIDSDERIVAGNATAYDWLGYARGSLDGAALSEVFCAASRVFFESHVAPRLLLQSEIHGVFLTLQSLSGTRVPVVLSAAHRTVETDAAPVVVTDFVCLKADARVPVGESEPASGARG